MKCPACRHDNPPESDICLNCRAPLTSVCGTCGARPPVRSNFCNQCGAPLRVISAPGPLASRAPFKEERKEVTVLFADLKGSMDLLAHRDPEDARNLLDPVLERMMDAVHRYEGTVNQVMGDGIMALFGAPVAYEDHAVRACRAALWMQEAVTRQSDGVLRSHGVQIQIRVGLNSGEVVVRSIGSDLRMDYTAVGQTTHVAARMEQMARPGSVLLTGDTMKLAEGYVQVKPVGQVFVKGLDTSVDVYELTGIGPARSRLEAGAVEGLTRFVGRHAELDHLHGALERSRAGDGQLVGVMGDPGVGKSRLFYEFVRQPWAQGWLVLATSAVSYEKRMPYLPVIDLLRTYFSLVTGDTIGQIREKVAGALLTLDAELEPFLPAFLALLDVPVENPAWQGLDPPQRRERILDGLKRLFLAESRVQPLCLVVENLHWIDSETEAFLTSLVGGLPSHRVLVLVNYRPEYRHAWGSEAPFTELKIDPLLPELARELLRALVGADPALAPLEQLLIDRTDGNPFFVEEMVRSLVETEALVGTAGARRLARPVARVQVPPTVKAVLASRIDRLPFEDKRLLQSAAVIGAHFDIRLLGAIADLPEDRLRDGLIHLQATDFLYESRRLPKAEYTFKHALTHEVAYSGLLHDRQHALHARIVGAIEALDPDRLNEQTERLAHHAFLGEVWDKAVEHLLRSGRRALFASAAGEAVESFERGLLALHRLPATRQTLKTGVALRLNLRDALWSLGRVGKIRDQLVEAEAIAQQLGDQRDVATITCYLCNYFWVVGDLEAAREASNRALAIASEVGDALLLAETRFYQGVVFLAEGAAERATQVLQSTLRELDRLGTGQPGKANRLMAIRLLVRCFLTRSLAELGRFAEGIACGEESLRLVEPHSTAFGLATALAGLGSLYLRKAEPHAAIPLLERGLEVCRTYSVNNWLPTIEASLGAAYVISGRVDEGVSLLEQAVDLGRRLGIMATLSLWRTYLGDAYLGAGRVAEALAEARRALAECRARGEHGYEAWALQLLGRIFAAQEPPDAQQARSHYLDALKLAEELGMRPLVVRCLVGLAQLQARTADVTGASSYRAQAARLASELGLPLAAVESA
jgi:class 3 adenylate cyclase/tetratricopeptide (TPR) repeat protein